MLVVALRSAMTSPGKDSMQMPRLIYYSMHMDQTVHGMVYSRCSGGPPRSPFKTESPIPQVARSISGYNFSAKCLCGNCPQPKQSPLSKVMHPLQSDTRAACTNDCPCSGMKVLTPHPSHGEATLVDHPSFL